ncbi:MAG: hypothetical protein IPH88_01045 [Bacteroidales bacterium]|nr:hypothetical protein [Bacteroidales bacterium]
MKFLKSIADFLIYGNFLIALCAAALALHTFISFHITPDFHLLLLILLSTIASYSFHAVLKPVDKDSSGRIAWIGQNKFALKLLLIVSVAALTYEIILTPGLLIWMVPLALLTALYSAPRLFGNKSRLLKGVVFLKTIYLALIWTLVTFIMPIGINDSFGQPGLLAFGLSRFMLILQICLLFEWHDRENNIIKGERILINMMSENMFQGIFLLLSTIVQLSAFYFLSRSDLAIFLSLFLPELSLILFFRKTLVTKSDTWYFLLIDGHLLLPAIIAYILEVIY